MSKKAKRVHPSPWAKGKEADVEKTWEDMFEKMQESLQIQEKKGGTDGAMRHFHHHRLALPRGSDGREGGRAEPSLETSRGFPPPCFPLRRV